MKRITLWVGIALLTFSVGVACALFRFLDHGSVNRQGGNAPAPSPPASQVESPEVQFCQMVSAPEEYEGKVIRVRAIYVVGKHGAMLRDRGCSIVEQQVWVSMSSAMWEELRRAMETVYEIKNVSGPLDVVFIGRFGRNHHSGGSDSLADKAPYKFELMRIESAGRPR